MKTIYIDRNKFAESRSTRSGAAIRKEYVTTYKQIGTEEDRTLSFTITTDSVDRHGDTVSATGWKTAAFMRNPVVLFAHDYNSLPVGKAVSLTPTGHGFRSTVKFAPATANPFAEQVYQLCKAGFLNAASVGFIPLDYEEADREGYYPMDIKEQELLEWSIVPVPANGEALIGRAAKSLGLSVSAFKSKFTGVGAERGGTLTKEFAMHKSNEIDLPAHVIIREIENALDELFGVSMERRSGETDLQWAYRTQGGATLKVR